MELCDRKELVIFLNLGICIDQLGTWHFICIFIIYTGILFLLLRCTYVDEEFAVTPIIVFFDYYLGSNSVIRIQSSLRQGTVLSFPFNHHHKVVVPLNTYLHVS